MNDDDFIFLDRSGTRWKVTRTVTVIALVCFILGATYFVQTLWIAPEFKGTTRNQEVQQSFKPLETNELIKGGMVTNASLLLKYESLESKLKRQARWISRLPSKKHDSSESIKLGYYVTWDPNSFQSLLNYGGSLTHVASECFSISKEGGLIEERDPRMETVLTAYRLKMVPVLSNYYIDEWNAKSLSSILHYDQKQKEAFFEDIIGRLQNMKAYGLMVDWRGILPEQLPAVRIFLKQLSVYLHRNNLEFWLTIDQPDKFNQYDKQLLVNDADKLILVMHGENGEWSDAGALASRDWFDNRLSAIPDGIDLNKVIPMLGNYACDWSLTSHDVETISFPDAMSRASTSRAKTAVIDSLEGSPHFGYRENNDRHTVWFLDAITFLNQRAILKETGFDHIGLYRLGTEDIDIWPFFSQAPEGPLKEMDIRILESINPQNVITHVGEGEFITVFDEPRPGIRKVSYDHEGYLNAKYEKFPRYTILYHQGEGSNHQVSITFDDGPDPDWTPEILDILKEKNVSAAFFVVGTQAEKYPELIKRIYDEGHEIGNHSYMHPNLAESSGERILVELNATQRLISSIIGHSTILFRPPYSADSRPNDYKEIIPIKIAQELGYITVCENIDTEDWQSPGSEEILQRVKDLRHHGNIVLLHDAGGDREQTIQALPRIIDYLRSRGDEIVPLGKLLGIQRDYIMPQVTPDESGVQTITGWVFKLLHLLEELIWSFMIVATVVVLIRSAIVAYFAFQYQCPGASGSDCHPPVSVLIAAYNEEKVIRKTLDSILLSDYPGEIEVIVVDDGSKDGTADVVSDIAESDRRVCFHTQKNQGKAKALQNAFEQSKYDILVLLDADTQFEKNTIKNLLGGFVTPDIGGVSGHAKVGNLKKFIARCQSLEYICGFNFDRRAYHVLNAITVLPGAICALKAKAVKEAGGFLSDTLAEDTDLTLKLHRLGYRIGYVSTAVAWTEAPETLMNLVKQRLRWAFGTLQCLWKHRDMFLNPRYGALAWFSLPSAWFLQIGLVAVAPLIDAMLIVSILFGGGVQVYIYFGAFLLVDLLIAYVACVMEEEPASTSLRIIPMRIIYRPLLSYVVWRSIQRAFRGGMVGWNKLERTATVENNQ